MEFDQRGWRESKSPTPNTTEGAMKETVLDIKRIEAKEKAQYATLDLSTLGLTEFPMTFLPFYTPKESPFSNFVLLYDLVKGIFA